MGRQQRWTILIIAVLTGLVICAVPLMLRSTSSHNDAHSGAAISDNPAGQGSGSNDSSEGADSPASNPTTGRPACPTEGSDTAATSAEGSGNSEDSGSSEGSDDANSPLGSVTLPCLGNSASEAGAQPLSRNLAGKPTVINLWAFWCQPCKKELPIVDKVAQSHPEWNVVGVHADKNGDAGVGVLSDLHVDHLASFQDSGGDVARALKLPSVIPITAVLTPNGEVAKVYPQTFTSTSELESAVTAALS
ncbi:TlpA family protein disulfide reductase [Corynebacterium kroppenstedtii]|uniref:TlpA disulfide reductase family protein n=2 Tax=Corynebacterium TaxID=1716 RepID=A0AAU0PX86_9CORY|nr:MULTISPECIES: TlpA disulfide reductase family protein [Corynebacterium]ACR18711.1 putative secreted protein [Corynebacterium kroppenstedtii DSM 44385]MBY0790445.1 TlpA family protein disulfide reductase [Corynebacterium pseudokroppenstedtii]MCF6793014.1 TlpA family protein disulfide reductase [Corynebacterium pseudokroppenstedtii]MCF8702189.1 TlpA family protein disulfide reductase [Corynebacterium pseudokroppenstedtii]MCG2635667.1 TlpA family protein disulfide reductase [Corynebacterium ps